MSFSFFGRAYSSGGGVKFFKILTGGGDGRVSDRFITFLGGLGKKGWGQYFRVGVIPWRTLWGSKTNSKIVVIIHININLNLERVEKLVKKSMNRPQIVIFNLLTNSNGIKFLLTCGVLSYYPCIICIWY